MPKQWVVRVRKVFLKTRILKIKDLGKRGITSHTKPEDAANIDFRQKTNFRFLFYNL